MGFCDRNMGQQKLRVEIYFNLPYFSEKSDYLYGSIHLNSLEISIKLTHHHRFE